MNTLHNTVIWSHNPLREIWPQLSGILDADGVVWTGGGERPQEWVPDDFVFVLVIDDDDMGFDGNTKINNPRLKMDYPETVYTYIEAEDLIKDNEGIDNFFFESYIKRIIREELDWGDFEKTDEEELVSILNYIFNNSNYEVRPIDNEIRVAVKGEDRFLWKIPNYIDPMFIEEYSQIAYKSCYKAHNYWCNRGRGGEGYQITNDMVKNYFKDFNK